MGYVRFWRRIRLFSGVYLNISKRGISFSFGPRGIKYTTSRKGQRITFGLPGTGLSYTKYKKWGNKNQSPNKSKNNLKELIKQIKGL